MATWVSRALLAAVLVSVRSMGAEGEPNGDMYRGSHALLIGVSDYTKGWADLPSVKSEMDIVQKALAKQGFTVQRVRNPNAQRLYAAYRDFIGKHGYDPDNRLLLYFAGHGYSRRQGKIGYVVPADAPLPTEEIQPFLRHALPMNQLLAWARTMEARHVLFVFDSCFSGTIFKSRALPQTLDAKLMEHPTRQFLTAGDAGEEVPAKSVFTPVFVRGIAGQGDLNGDGLVTGSELGSFVRDKVMGYATGQTPQFGRLREAEFASGDFIFRPDGALLTAPPAGKAEQTEKASERVARRHRQDLNTEADRVDALQRELARLRVDRHGDGSAHSVATVYLLKATEMSLAAGEKKIAGNLLRQVKRLEPGNKDAAALHAKLEALLLADRVAELEQKAKETALALRELRVPRRLRPLRRHLLELVATEGSLEERARQLEDFRVLERALHHQLKTKEEQTLHAELLFVEPMNSRVHCRGPFTLLLCNPGPKQLNVPSAAIRDLRIRFMPHAHPSVMYTPATPFQGMRLDRPAEELAPFAVHRIPGQVSTSGLTREPYMRLEDGQPITLPDGLHDVLATMAAKKRRTVGKGRTWSGKLSLPSVVVAAGALGAQPGTPADQRVRVALSFGKMAIRVGEPVRVYIMVRNTYGEPFLADFWEARRTMTVNFEPVEGAAERPFRLPGPFRGGRHEGARPFGIVGSNYSSAVHFPPNLPSSYVGKRYRVHVELTFPERPNAWSGTVRSPEVEVTILPRE